MADNGETKRPTRTVTKDLFKDPEFAQSSYEQRVKYFNLPEVQRALAIERAEKIKPKGKPN